MVKAKTKKRPVKKTKATAVSRPVARAAAAGSEADSFYILKLVLYLIIGSLWIRFTFGNVTLPLPLGAIVGVLFARTERFQLDRKIEYAMLLLAMFVGFWLPIGLEIVL